MVHNLAKTSTLGKKFILHESNAPPTGVWVFLLCTHPEFELTKAWFQNDSKKSTFNFETQIFVSGFDCQAWLTMKCSLIYWLFSLPYASALGDLQIGLTVDLGRIRAISAIYFLNPTLILKLFFIYIIKDYLIYPNQIPGYLVWIN